MEYDVEKIVNDMDFFSDSLVDCGNVMLTNREIEVLERYKIDYKSCSNLKDVLMRIEDVFYNEDLELLDDLDAISLTIAERDYYENTNK
ncbi:MAG: hypothetical protein PUC82_00885 [bacterium]|nr:hypothetical protein [bacterium]